MVVTAHVLCPGRVILSGASFIEGPHDFYRQLAGVRRRRIRDGHHTRPQHDLHGIAISASVNTIIVVMAGSISAFLAARPLWSRIQRWIMGTVLGLLALRMVVDARK